MGLVILKSGETISEAELHQQLLSSVRNNIGSITCYKDTIILARLPKTRSGKTLRKTLCNIINGQEYTVASTIDDPGVIQEIIDTLRNRKVIP
jgi:propionyl-CoA synthetase